VNAAFCSDMLKKIKLPTTTGSHIHNFANEPNNAGKKEDIKNITVYKRANLIKTTFNINLNIYFETGLVKHCRRMTEQQPILVFLKL
jgi:hypothetical protein